MTDNNNNKSSTGRAILLGLVALLAGGAGWLAYTNFDKSEKIEQLNDANKDKEEEIAQQVEQIKLIQDDLEEIRKVRDSLNLDNSELKTKIEELDKLMAQAKANANSSNAQKVEFERQLRAIKVERDRLLAEIKSLHLQNDTLVAANDSLVVSKRRLGDSISELKTKELDYKQKIEIASILKAESFKIEALDSKGKVREGDEFKSKRIEKLKVSFKFADNKVAKSNSKNIYLRLIEPSGTALFDLATGGGTTEAEGRTISYTAKKEVEFDNSRQLVTFVYEKPTEYVKGQHKIEIYADGHFIGESSFLVK